MSSVVDNYIFQQPPMEVTPKNRIVQYGIMRANGKQIY